MICYTSKDEGKAIVWTVWEVKTYVQACCVFYYTSDDECKAIVWFITPVKVIVKCKAIVWIVSEVKTLYVKLELWDLLL